MILTILICVVLAVLGFMLATGVPVAVALLSAGCAGFIVIEGNDGLDFIGNLPWDQAYSFDLGAIPLYVFTGFLLQAAGIVTGLMHMFRLWTARLPGSLSIVSLLTAGVFASMSGSGSGAAATLGSILYPEGKAYGYAPRLLLGPLCGGACLAPLIPPSTAIVLYGSLTSQSVSLLFAAAILPGVVVLLLMLTYVVVAARRSPLDAPVMADAVTWGERWRSLSVLPGAIVIMFLIVGGVLLGWYTPTESASIGVVLGTIALAARYRRSPAAFGRSLWAAMRQAGETAAFILLIIVCGFIFSETLTYFGLPLEVSKALTDAHLPRVVFLILLVLIALVLGCFLDSTTLLVVTVPFLLPTLQAYGVDLIWFGILMTVLVEVGTLTPPFGVHLFILQGVTGEPFSRVTKAAMPFTMIWISSIAVIFVFPQITRILPHLTHK